LLTPGHPGQDPGGLANMRVTGGDRDTERQRDGDRETEREMEREGLTVGQCAPEGTHSV
jgi:hypothetical protein